MKLENIKNILNTLQDTSKLMDEDTFDDILEFLYVSQNGEVPIILYDENVWLNSVIVPIEYLKSNYIDALLNWSIFVSSSYGYYLSSDGFKLTPPCESYKPAGILRNAVPIFLERSCLNHTLNSIEINQELSHRLDIVELEERGHFYKLNEYGDKEEVASILKDENLTIATLNREELDKYLEISNSVLIRFFNIDIFDKINPSNSSEEIVKLDSQEIYYKSRVQCDDKSNPTFKEIRGFQIIRSNQKFEDEDLNINYQDFKVFDFKSGKIVVNSCNPKNLGNFFVESDNIYEISPAFFRTEVFKKYYDADKYQITNRYIECKGVWSLRYSLSDDKSQVIVYIKDLGNLPEYEQKYWNAFNEEPKSNIAEHIRRTDFLGEWDNVIDPLIALKNCLRNFPSCYLDRVETKIWVEKNKNNIRSLDNLQYIKHPTKEIWDFEVKKLHQIVVEGFVEKKIIKIAKKLDCYDKKLASLKQLKECISNLYDEDIANNIVNPLLELHHDRNRSAHAKTENTYPKDLIQDYNNKIRGCYISMKWLSEKINEGKFNFD